METIDRDGNMEFSMHISEILINFFNKTQVSSLL
jgi:hypothetical protein